MRGISILLVLITHLGFHRLLPPGDFFRGRLWALMSGEMGVNMFFGLSGFLITTLLLREQARAGTIQLKKFYARRFLRLLPPLAVYLVVVGILHLAGWVTIWTPGLLVSFLYAYNFMITTHYDGLLGHTWSLGVEEQFYLIWPFILRSFKSRTVLLIALGLVLASVVAYHVLPTLVIPGSRHDTLVSNVFHIRRLFVPAVAPIMIGSMIGMLNHRSTDLVRKLCALQWWPLGAVLLIASPLVLPALMLPSVVVLQALGVSMMLLWIGQHQHAPLTNLLEWMPLAYVGRISYGLYVYHMLFMSLMPDEGFWIRSLVLSVASLLSAAISYEFMEKRLLRYKDRFR